MDKCWLDVSGSQGLFGNGYEIASQIKEKVKHEVGLTVSIGVSFNKIFAKLGSDMKKPDAITCIKQETFKEQIWELPASDLLGVGRATTKKLESRCIRTIGDIAKCPPDYLKRMLGVNGVALWKYANGLDASPVQSFDYKAPIKSMGHGITCVSDLINSNEVWCVMLELTQDISHKSATSHNMFFLYSMLDLFLFRTDMTAMTIKAIQAVWKLLSNILSTNITAEIYL